MKKCPYCAEEIQDAALKCKHCGSTMPEVGDEIKRRQFHEEQISKEAATQMHITYAKNKLNESYLCFFVGLISGGFLAYLLKTLASAQGDLTAYDERILSYFVPCGIVLGGYCLWATYWGCHIVAGFIKSHYRNMFIFGTGAVDLLLQRISMTITMYIFVIPSFGFLAGVFGGAFFKHTQFSKIANQKSEVSQKAGMPNASETSQPASSEMKTETSKAAPAKSSKLLRNIGIVFLIVIAALIYYNFYLMGPSPQSSSGTLNSNSSKKLISDEELAANFTAQAMKEIANGAWDKAVSGFSQAIVVNPQDAQSYYRRGSCYLQMRSYDRAIADFTKAAEIDPNYAGAYSARGAVYLDTGNFKQAIEDTNRAIQIRPDFSVAYEVRGDAYRKQDKLDQALADLNKSIEINDAVASAYHRRSLVYREKGNLNKSIADSTRAIELNSQLGAAYYVRGITYFRKKDYDKSWQDMHKAESLGVEIRLEDIEALKKASGRSE